LIVGYANGNSNNKGHDADPCDIISHLPVLSIKERLFTYKASLVLKLPI
jgi:hypothetical protein